MIRLLFLMVMLLNLSCQQRSISERQRRKAPHSEQEAGIAVTGFSEDQIQKLLEQNPSAEVRTLSTKHGLYELFQISKDQIAKEPGQIVADNQFVAQPAPLEVPGWAPCQFAKPLPPLNWQIISPSISPQGETFLAPQNLELKLFESSQHQNAVLLAYPKFSGLGEKWVYQERLFEDIFALGEYSVVAASQDQNQFCKTDSLRFILTSNDPWSQLKLPPISQEYQFSHLEMVAARLTRLKFKGMGIKIAVIDSGANYNDPSIQEQVSLNLNEMPDNNFDNDKNGFKNDVIGYDFVNDDPFPFDDDGHGTHITGLIAAKEFGIAPAAQLILVKSANSFGADFATVSAGIYYAVDRGAQIINLSFGGPTKDPTLEKALLYAKDQGVLVVIAAGNGDPNTGLGFDLDTQPLYPASSDLENIITVGAYDHTNTLSPYSNFGKDSVDIVAPGGFYQDLVESLAYKNPLNVRILGMMGTSMAAPMVAAVAAQVWAKNPKLKAHEVKEVLMSSVTPVEDLKNITVSGGVLNSRLALDRVKF